MHNLALDFPVLRHDGMDFNEDVAYSAEVTRDDSRVIVKHRLSGKSFIRRMIEEGNAKFCVFLFYSECSERQHHAAVDFEEEESGDIVCFQKIDNQFSYGPHVVASIVALQETSIEASDKVSGLSDFWNNEFVIPEHARIAVYPRLSFSDGGFASLFRLEHNEQLPRGEMKVRIDEEKGEGEGAPVVLQCSTGVYDIMKQLKDTNPRKAQVNDPRQAFGFSIVTQALCAFYYHMRAVAKKQDDYQEKAIIKAHLYELQEVTGENWHNQNFNPVHAATKMCPFMTSAIRRKEGDENA